MMKFKKPSLPKIKKSTLYTGIAIINPLVGAGLIMKNENDKDPEKFKSTLKGLHETIKTDVGQGFSTIGKGVKGGSKLIGGAFDKLMLPLFVAGGLVLAILVLKK